MVFADELILEVESRVGVAIRRPRERGRSACQTARMHLGLDAVGTDGHAVAIPAVLICQAPVWRYAMHDVALRTVERMVAAADGGTVDAEFGVNAAIDPGIDADAGGILTDAAGAGLEFGRGDGSRRHAAAGIGEAPGRGGVPDILHRGSVVHGDADEHIGVSGAGGAAEIQMSRVADVGVVESETVRDSVISELHEAAQAVGDFTGVE